LPLTPAAALSTLSLHDALPISFTRSFAGILEGSGQGLGQCDRDLFHGLGVGGGRALELGACHRLGDGVTGGEALRPEGDEVGAQDRKSTRLNSSHVKISYAVFC